jgi:hypothetical protein
MISKTRPPTTPPMIAPRTLLAELAAASKLSIPLKMSAVVEVRLESEMEEGHV